DCQRHFDANLCLPGEPLIMAKKPKQVDASEDDVAIEAAVPAEGEDVVDASEDDVAIEAAVPAEGEDVVAETVADMPAVSRPAFVRVDKVSLEDLNRTAHRVNGEKYNAKNRA